MAQLLSPLLAEDLYAFRFASDAQISPDGERVAFVLRTIDREANAYRSTIHVVPADGSAPARPLTHGPGEDAGPRWSPDGTRLAFVSDRATPRGEKRRPKQVYVVTAAGGEATRLVGFADDCADLMWSPRGDRIVFVAKDPADAPADADAVRVFDRIRYKSDEAGLFDGRRKHVWVVGLADEPRRVTDGDWDDTQPAFSPDGAWIAFVSDRTAERDLDTVNEIWVTPAAGGAARRVTHDHGSFGNPSWSPDGSAITCYGVDQAVGAQSQNVRLWRFDSKGGGAGIDLLGDWDRTVGSVVINDMRGHVQTLPPAWTQDGERVHFVASDQGTANLYSVSSRGGDLRATTMGPHQVVSASADREARRFAAIVATATEPGDVHAIDGADGMRRLTRVNGELLDGRFLAEPERVQFAGADGWTIEGWLLRPRGFDPAKSWPLVLEIHGGPHSAYGHSFFHEFQVLAGRGYAVLYTNPRGSHAYGRRFVEAVVGDWGGKDHEDLMAAVDHALGWDWVDADRLYVTGGSYGGFMTNWIVGHTDRFKAAATQRSISNNLSAFGTSDIGWHFWGHEHGGVPWRDAAKLLERSPLAYVESVRTPLLILHAERDLRCPIEQAEQLFVALKVLGREAVFVRFPEDGHELTRGGKPRNRVEHCRRIADWFDSHP